MARAVAEYLQADQSLLIKVTADTFSQPATRPLKTNLVIDKAMKELGFQPVSFSEGLAKSIEN